MSKDRSNRFTWGEGDVEHHGPKVQEIVWKKVGNIPESFRKVCVVEMFVAVNTHTNEVFAGVNKMEPHIDGISAAPFYVATYTTKKSVLSGLGESSNHDTFEECLAECNKIIASSEIVGHKQSDEKIAALMLEDCDVA